MSLFNSLIPSLARQPAARDAAAAAPGIVPAHEIREAPEAYGLTVYLPGVAKDGLELTAENGQLRVAGRRAWKRPESWTALYRESADAPFELVLEIDSAIDVDRIHAELADGVLRVSLPKSESLKPRKIAVN
jgi:HSP20 family molecular chaperone IbpA